MRIKSKLKAIPLAMLASPFAVAEPVLEEVVVTAERRETSLQSTPAAIVALTGESIESAGINNLNELTLTTPGISISGINRNQQYVSMRGNVTEGGDAGLAQSIGFFIDGLYFGRSSLFNQNLSDIERVEILRGPQGTLWGHNIVGGSINVITKDPTEELKANLKVSTGKYSRREVSGGISGGLAENMAGSLSFTSEKADGYVTNLDSGQDLNSEDVYLVRGKLVWDVAENFTAKLTGTYQKDTSGMNARVFVPGPDAVMKLAPPPVPVPPEALLVFEIPENYEEETYQRSAIGTNDFETKVLSLSLDYALDNGITLSSLTGRIESNGFVDNFGFFPFPESYGKIERDHGYEDEAFSQEFRIAGESESVFWQAGVYYYNASNVQAQSTGNWGLRFT
ncbi:MAG: TonB-dependent receptor plug domain-containing protein, partial [Halieaceae bacterium]